MAKRKLLSRLQRFWFSSRCDKAKGFTLLELLVVTAIAGGIVAGLMYIVVELMGADQRESSKSETQREMQLALDYISTEMRDAAYVYTGDRMDAQPERNNQNLMSFLPPSLTTNSVPVVAFWKQQPFPDAVKIACAGAAPPTTIACTNGSSYALVVYSLSQVNPSSVWKGKARITRYTLTEFKSDGTPTPGYVNPGANNNNFDIWPYGATDTGFIDLQRGVRPTDNNAAALVDFVDMSTSLPNAGQVGVCPDDPATAGPDYNISPSIATLSNGTGSPQPFPNVRSFYACVNARQGLGQAQDTLLYLRGNVFGRPGNFGATSFLPTLETRVLSRGVLGRVPD
jgi:prepilin-type N-terminal cleavage/methylation domain-containing protein